MPYSEYCHLKSFCICKIELSIKNWGGGTRGTRRGPREGPNFFRQFRTIVGQFLDNFSFPIMLIFCDIKVVIKNPGEPGGLNGIPGIQKRPIVGDLVDLGEPGGSQFA